MERDLRRRAAIALLLVLAVGVVAASSHFVPITQNNDGVVLNQPGGPSVNLTGNFDMYPQRGGSGDTIQWNTSAGNASFSSSGSTSVTLSTNDLSGTWTNLSALDVTGAELTINPATKRSISVQGDADELRFRDATLDDGTVDFVVGAASGSSTVTVRGLPSSTTISAVNQSSGKPIAVTTSDASGTASFSISHSTQTVLLQQGDQTNQPTLSNADPTTDLSNPPSQLSIDIEDGDMPEDTLDAEFFLKKPGDSSFSSAGTDSLTSNGTASTSITANTGGVYEWYVEVDDDVGGNTVTSSTFTFGVPDELRIFNETSPNNLVTSPTEVTVQFFAENGSVYERSTTNGVIDFTGLPVDQDFIIQATATDYFDRTVYLPSLIEQQEIYLLPSITDSGGNLKFPSSDIQFRLDDRSGEFTPVSNTTLFIEKPLTISGSTEYRTIVSDQFSATDAVVAKLENDQRYRLRVRNNQGDTRLLGSYRPTEDATEVLPIGEIRFDEQRDSGVAFQAQLVNFSSQRYIQIRYGDPEQDTTNLSIEVFNRSDPSDILKPNTTIEGPFGRYGETIQVPSTAPGDVTYEIRWHANRTGEDDGATVFVGDIPNIATGLGIDPTVLEYIVYVGIAALTGLVIIFDDRLAAVVAVLAATVFTMLGAISVPPVGLGIGGSIAVLYMIGRSA